jgi:hypothetical protein
MSTLTSYTSGTRPAASANSGLCIFRTDTNAIEVSDGTDWQTYNSDGVIIPWTTNAYSLSTDGVDDYLACGSLSLLNSAGSYSVSAWVNMDASGSGGGILASGTADTNRMFLTVSTSGVLFANKTGGGGVANYSSTLSTGAWYHVVGVKDGATAYLYVNGTQQATASVSATLGATAGTNFQIGAYPTGMTANQFPGLIDEVALFSTALSSSDVSSIYNSGSPDDLSAYSPVHHWRMGDNDGGSGSTVTDVGSGGSDGTMTNEASFSTTVPS